MGEMRDRGGHDITTPGILEGHRNPEGKTEIPRLTRPGEPPELADLDINGIHRQVLRRLENLWNSIYDLIEDERVPAMTSN